MLLFPGMTAFSLTLWPLLECVYYSLFFHLPFEPLCKNEKQRKEKWIVSARCAKELDNNFFSLMSDYQLYAW